ncbi:MAG: hypothetical protein ACM65L_09110 [Microcoleus sp.]
MLAQSSGLDNIVYFQGDRDYFGLSQDLTFDQLQDDDILIYDTKSLLTSLTSAQSQPILPLKASSVNSAIAPIANPSGKEADLLLNANPSPIQLPKSSDLSGTSTLK